MINWIKFDGIKSTDFGLYVGGQQSFRAPVKNIIKQSIPNRNGAFVIDNGVFDNVLVTYVLLGIGNFKSKINDIKEWLLSPNGYVKLEDSYNPDYYRMGMVVNGIDFIMHNLNTIGKANVLFDCKPQRYLTVGDSTYELGSSGTLVNPTKFSAKPLIHVEGYGKLRVNGTQITVANEFPEVYIDCEAMDCYSGTGANANAAVSFSTDDFPTLKAGNNAYTVNQTHITAADIVPRWWTV